MLQNLRTFVEQNPSLVQIKQSIQYPELSIIKYKRKCFYDNIWNEYIINCRGLVVDRDWNIINYPFTKIFNYGIEKNAPVISDNEIVTAVRKVNGFMAAASIYKNELLVSTTGSLDSDYAKLAKKMIEETLYDVSALTKNHTYIFEICHSSDPHIIPETQGIYFLGMRENVVNSPIINNRISYREYKENNIFLPEVIVDKFKNIKQLVKEAKHEGFVIYTIDGRTTKIKSPYYLFKKFLARTNNIQKILSPTAKKNLPEEFYSIIDVVRNDIDNFMKLPEQERLTYIRNIFNNV